MKKIFSIVTTVAVIGLSSCAGTDEKPEDKLKSAPSAENNARVADITCECANEVLSDYESADEIDEAKQSTLKAEYMECVKKYKDELESMKINQNEVSRLMKESCPKSAQIMEAVKKRMGK